MLWFHSLLLFKSSSEGQLQGRSCGCGRWFWHTSSKQQSEGPAHFPSLDRYRSWIEGKLEPTTLSGELLVLWSLSLLCSVADPNQTVMEVVRIVWIITQPKMVREVELHNLTLEDGPTGVVLPEGIYVGCPLQVWWETGPLEPAWLSGKFSTQQFLSTEWFEMVQVSISSQSWTVTAQAGWS